MTDQKLVVIAGLSKAAVLAALYNASEPQGLGFLQARPGDMTEAEAEALVTPEGAIDDHVRHFGRLSHQEHRLYFDYVFGRPLKVDLTKDEFDPWGFDRDNGGPGAAEKVVARLRERSGVGA